MFSATNPFKSRMAAEVFNSNDPVAKGTGDFLKKRGRFADDVTNGLPLADEMPGGGPEGDVTNGLPKDEPIALEPPGGGRPGGGVTNGRPPGDVTNGRPPGDVTNELPKWDEEGSAQEAGFRNANERRLGREEYKRLAGSGLQDGDSKGRYSGKEVIAEMRGGRNGKSTEDMAAYYQGLADDGTKFNKRAQEFLSKKHGVTFKGRGGAGTGSEETHPIAEDPETGGGGGAGAGNEGGAPDTEGGAAQEFADRYKYKVGGFTHKPRDYDAISSGIANRALERADQRDIGELVALQKSVDRNPLYWKARSDVQTGDYLGDIWNFQMPDYKMPKPLDPVEPPDLKGIADDYMDRIDKIKPEL